MNTWSSEQAFLISSCKYLTIKQKISCATIVRIFKGKTGSLPIAKTSSGWISYDEILELKNIPDEVIIAGDHVIYFLAKENAVSEMELKLFQNVFVTDLSQPIPMHIHNF